jgi:hypothetical protein
MLETDIIRYEKAGIPKTRWGQELWKERRHENPHEQGRTRQDAHLRMPSFPTPRDLVT